MQRFNGIHNDSLHNGVAVGSEKLAVIVHVFGIEDQDGLRHNWKVLTSCFILFLRRRLWKTTDVKSRLFERVIEACNSGSISKVDEISTREVMKKE